MKKSIGELNVEKLSLSKLYDTFSEDIYRYSFSILKDSEEAKDALQETFARYAESENSFREECSQKTWLLIIARNYCFNRLRSESFKNQKIEKDFFDQTDESDYDSIITLKEALLKLSEEYSEMIFLVDYAGYSYKEISEFTKQSIENVKIKIYRARQELRKYLKER